MSFPFKQFTLPLQPLGEKLIASFVLKSFNHMLHYALFIFFNTRTRLCPNNKRNERDSNLDHT